MSKANSWASSARSTSAKLCDIENLRTEFEVKPGLEFSLFLETLATKVGEKSALIQFEFLDNASQRIPVDGWHPISKKFGEFKYLRHEVADEPSPERIDLSAPAGAYTLRITGHQWDQNVSTSILGDIQIQVPSDSKFVKQFASGNPIPFPSEDIDELVSIPKNAGQVDVELTYQSNPKVKTLTPVQVKFYDADQKYIPGVSDLPQNVSFGSFLPLEKSGNERKVHRSSIQVPPKASFIRFRGVDWTPQNAVIYGDISVTTSKDEQFLIEEWIETVPEEAQLIVIDTTAPPLGHETLSLRPNNLSKAYSGLGSYVIFLPFSSLQEFVPRVSDRLVQVPREDFSFLIELLLKKRKPANSVFISSSFPSINAITASKRLKAQGWTIIYEARDDMEEFKRVGYSKWYEPQLERQMLRIADKIISVSSALDEKLHSLWPSMKDHCVIPNGVNSEVIISSTQLRTLEAAKSRNTTNVVGYVGHLTPSWFDWELIIGSAQRNPSIKFEIVGHGKPESVVLPPNIQYLGPKTHSELPSIVSKWKCGLIPFKNLPLTRSVDPNKIYEYFAWGLRCLTAPMGLVEEYPSTWVYRSSDEFDQMLGEILKSDFTSNEINSLEEFLQSASWDHRAMEMLRAFESTVKMKGNQNA